MTRYWIAVANREHVLNGVKLGIAQVCHGKVGPLKRMKPDDWIIYYSSVEWFGEKTPCRRFTAIGRVNEGEPYEFAMSENFIPWRRDITFFSAREVAIEPLIDTLSFIRNKRSWGLPFRYGFFEIPESDFYTIAGAMGISADE